MQKILDEKKKADAQATRDLRDITMKDVYDVLDSALTWDSTKTFLHDGVFFDPERFKEKRTFDVFIKLFPYDAAADLGVKMGTKVLVGGVEGKVKSKSAKHDHVVIEVDGREDKEETVLFVMEHAVKGLGVVSVEAFQRKVVLFMCSVISIVTIYKANHHNSDTRARAKYNVYIYLLNKIAKLEGKSYPNGTFPKERRGEMDKLQKSLGAVEKIYPMIWRVVRTISAEEITHLVPKEQTEFCKQPGSQLKILGLKKFEDKEFNFDNGNMGIFRKKVIFNGCGNAGKLVSTVVKAFQQGFRRGGLTSTHSAVFPLRVKEFNVLVPNVEFGKEKLMAAKEKPNGMTKWDKYDTSSKTRAMEGLLDKNDSSWFPHLPLSVIETMNARSACCLKPV